MPSWSQLVQELNALPSPAEKDKFIKSGLDSSLAKIQSMVDGRNVILYSSAFLQKPTSPGNLISISPEDINGIMNSIHGLDCSKGLTLILHTPGGVTNAAETIVDYLRAKFAYIEVIIPTYAMSAGTMISLASDKIIMGRQSQLGPIDPQLPVNGSFVSSLAILDQFKLASAAIEDDEKNALFWAPILPSFGPALYAQAKHAISYSETIVSGWLKKYSLISDPDKAEEIAAYFSKGSENKKNHGRRIDREEARTQGLKIGNLEDNQDFQDAILTAYHFQTIIFDNTPTAKIIANHNGQKWIKPVPNPAAPLRR